MRPLILSLNLNADLARELTRWRKRYFPPERNYLDAHVTLFHALPSENLTRISSDLREVAASTPAFEIRVSTPYSLGRGVALAVEAGIITTLRKELRGRWLADLGPQDRVENIRPHVTIQNKVSGDEARATLAEVNAAWNRETRGRALGLALWEYEGGPWRHLETFAFKSGASSSS